MYVKNKTTKLLLLLLLCLSFSLSLFPSICSRAVWFQRLRNMIHCSEWREKKHRIALNFRNETIQMNEKAKDEKIYKIPCVYTVQTCCQCAYFAQFSFQRMINQKNRNCFRMKHRKRAKKPNVIRLIARFVVCIQLDAGDEFYAQAVGWRGGAEQFIMLS